MINSRINYHVEGHIAQVELARADKKNALDKQMFAALLSVAEEIRQDKNIRVVLLSGQGDSFCAGLDMANFKGVLDNDKGLSDGPKFDSLTSRTHGKSNDLQEVVWQWRDLSVPVIAAINGVAFGGGLQICLAADMRYAAKDSQFSIMEIKWGLIPDMGGSQLMRHLASEDIVRELTYTGQIFDAQQAKDYGFITQISDDPLEHAVQVAQQIAQQNPAAIKASKRLLNQAPYLSVEQGLLMESQEQDRIVASPNQIEAVMAALQNRSTNFSGD